MSAATRMDLAPGYERFLEALAAADRRGAVAVADELLDAGADATRILLEIICPAQHEVGARWQGNRWSVAQEHAATAISEAVVARIAVRAEVEPRKGEVIIACVEEEWHALPARVVAEALALAGWRTTYLGASTPPTQLAGYLNDAAPQAVALSCSIATNLPRAHRMIRAAKRTGALVLVGGSAFRGDPELARRMGADGWAASALEAVEVLEALEPAEPPEPFEHPGLDEHARLEMGRTRLVEAAFDRLAERFPPLRGYDAEQLARTREDLGYIVDFLGAAVYVEVPAIFHDFTDWLQDVLVTRGVHEGALQLSYDALGEALGDAPRSSELLAAAAARLPAPEAR